MDAQKKSKRTKRAEPADFDIASKAPPLPPPVTVSDDKEHKGLRCPRCKCGHFETEWTRAMCANKIRRRRRCRYCGEVIFTQEKADP